MKREYRKTEKKLRDLRNMTFLFREVNEDGTKFRDYYRHNNCSITLIRYSHGTDDMYVVWYCPELGGGNCNLSYWLKLAKKERTQYDSHGSK